MTGGIETRYLDQNPCYTRPQRITPRYLIVHSTGCPMKDKEDLFNRWNKKTAQLSVHGMVDGKGSLLTLPLHYRGWHAGAAGNGQTVGLEICEPPNIRYRSGSTIDRSRYDPGDPAVRADFEARYQNAVALARAVCRETGLAPDRILSHAEGYKKGLASNHADVGHWFPLFGRDMDQFRQAVAKAPEQQEEEAEMATYFRTLEEVPDALRPETKELIEAGALKGTGGSLHVTEDMLRVMIISKRYTDSQRKS